MQITLYDILTRIKKTHRWTCNYFVDIGANHGDVTKVVTSVFNECRGVMIEPNADLTQKLANVNSNFTVIQAGAGKSAGVSKFNYSNDDTNACGGTFARRNDDALAVAWFKEERDVEIVTLDNLLAEGKLEVPDFLKLDAEGMELDILEGATQLIGKTDLIMLETTLYPSLIVHPNICRSHCLHER